VGEPARQASLQSAEVPDRDWPLQTKEARVGRDWPNFANPGLFARLAPGGTRWEARPARARQGRRRVGRLTPIDIGLIL